MNPYNILGVNPNDDEKTIKDAYRKLLKKYHPDTPTGDKEKFQQVQEAFENIKNKPKNTNTSKSNIDIDEIFSNYKPFFGGGFGNRMNIVNLATTVSANDAEYGCVRFFKVNDKVTSINLPPNIRIGSSYSASADGININIKIGFSDPDYEYTDKLIKNERISAKQFLENSHIEITNHRNESFKITIKEGMTTQQLLRIPKAGLNNEPLYVRIVVVK
jgi:curved DNA-binding protein CbpA